MPTKKPARVEIHKSRSKNNPFKVALIAENGETLMTSELLSTYKNCIKNIISVMGLFRAVDIAVVDQTSKINNHFILDNKGKKHFIHNES